MFSSEEQQFMDLATKFRDELAHIDKQIDELTERRNTILHVLYGENQDAAGIIVEGGEILEEDEETPEQPSYDRATIDKALVKFLKKTPGSSRRNIEGFFTGWNMSSADVERTLKRCKNQGLIVSEGKSRAAVWYALESN